MPLTPGLVAEMAGVSASTASLDMRNKPMAKARIPMRQLDSDAIPSLLGCERARGSQSRWLLGYKGEGRLGVSGGRFEVLICVLSSAEWSVLIT